MEAISREEENLPKEVEIPFKEEEALLKKEKVLPIEAEALSKEVGTPPLLMKTIEDYI